MAIILRIGSKLRELGLNQNAEKTKILNVSDARSEIYNEIAENIKQIIEASKKGRANRVVQILKLRQEYKRIYRRKKFVKKLETALFMTYNAARILETPLLKNRLKGDFLRFPVRSRVICNYSRTFINAAPVFRAMEFHLHRHEFLYHLQIAHLVAVFRNLKVNNKKVLRNIISIIFKSKRHWYVKAQAINTLFYLSNNGIAEAKIKSLLNENNHRYIRRAALTLLPLSYNLETTKKLLEKIAQDLNVTVSRMANFLLCVINDKDFATNQIKKFHGLDSVFIGDQIWRLWYVALNNNKDVRKSLTSLLKRIDDKYNRHAIIKEHIKKIRGLQL